ncbi:unnamed protein product [Arabis nemorensis]|uniref:Uncharacterized protein n=1 Tax=Arabis nemorensis TaxID=586526 RepID=A0A565B942_9BRAS|nr:unnamed protein product [Arabis nemorensis]
MDLSPFTSPAHVDLEKLSERLFVTGDYPSVAHINVYSKPELLRVIVESLKPLNN